MTVSRRLVRGARVWIIDLRFRGPHGEERYRRAAKHQGKLQALEEERRIQQFWIEHGTIKPLLAGEEERPKARRNHTWDDAVQHWKDHELRTVSASTRRGYEAVLKHPAFAGAWNGRKLVEIKRTDLVTYFAGLGERYKPATLHQHRSVIMGVLKSVGPHDDDRGVMLDALPSFPAKVKVGKQVVQVPSDADIAAIFAEKPQRGSYLRAESQRRLHLAYALAAYAGLRASEVRALTRDDVAIDRRVLTVRHSEHYGHVETTKSGDERIIPIEHPRLVTALKGRLAEMAEMPGCDSHIAIQDDGKPWGQYGLRNAYRRTATRLKLPLSRYHGLRYYYCTLLIRKGVSLTTVQYLMGHSSLTVTDRYAHVVEAEGRQAEIARAFADVAAQ